VGISIGTRRSARVLVCIAALAGNPLRRSEANIEASLLTFAPLGSSVIEVLHALEKEGLFARLVSGGVNKQKPGTPERVVGVKAMDVPLGEYRSPFVTRVSAIFAFDAAGKLIDVWVLKTADAP